MVTDALTNPTVKAAITALRRDARKAWSALFEPDAKPYDDGSARNLEQFARAHVRRRRRI